MTVLRNRWRTAAIGVESVRVTDIQTAYDELYVYTMGRPNFILQHVVDAHMAQTGAADHNASIGIVFALVGRNVMP